MKGVYFNTIQRNSSISDLFALHVRFTETGDQIMKYVVDETLIAAATVQELTREEEPKDAEA